LISTRWLDKRRPHWARLETLVGRAQGSGLSSLTAADLQELGLLYRQAAADLAAIRQDPTSETFARYLNQLLARAHNTIYAGHRGNYRTILAFFRDAWPAILRRNMAPCLVAICIFAASAVVGAALTWQDPDFKLKVLGPQMVSTIEQHKMWTDSILAVKPHASSRIMTNNLSVSFMAFACGITAGVGTILLLMLNGVMLGVIGMACWHAGMSLALWSFVAPHGVLELPAIFIASGAGLRMAQGLLFPGTLPRGQSLSRAGSEATRLLMGVIPMLVLAGIIEAFVSPTALPVPLKFMLAAALFVLFVALVAPRAVDEGSGTKRQLQPQGP
jgi:uncharacterized membrane protein SpoIIM required for sporulation